MIALYIYWKELDIFVTCEGRVYGNFNTVNLTLLRIADVDVQAIDAIVNSVN